MWPEFESLSAEDVSVRVGTCNADGVSLLLYKDARCDMRVLDKTVGPCNWQCDYMTVRDQLFCDVSIKCDGEWVHKMDAGRPSSMEAEKGCASDAFKRACFRWGIGRELYTAPFIWVPASECRIKERDGRKVCYDRFKVTEVEVQDGKIAALEIVNEKTGKVVFKWSSEGRQQSDADKAKQRLWVAIKAYASLQSLDPSKIADDLTKRSDFEQTVEFYERMSQEFEDAVK